MTSLPNDRGRLLRASLAAAIVAPAAYTLGLLAFGVARNVAQGRPSALPPVGSIVDLVAVVTLVGLPIAALAALLLGVPGFLALRRFGQISRPALWTLGALIGAAVAAMMGPHLRGELFSIPFPWWVGMALGLLSAEVFRRVL